MGDTVCDSHPNVRIAMEQRVDGNYCFPYFMKFVVWFIVIAIMIASSMMIYMCGMSWGMIKINFLITACSTLLVIGILLNPSAKTLFTLSNSASYKKSNVIISRKIRATFLSNLRDEVKRQEIMRSRRYNSNLYSPMPLHKLQSRKKDIKYNIELRCLTADVIAHVSFLAVLFFLLFHSQTLTGYYGSEVVKNLVLRGHYTKTIPFLNVTNYNTFLAYLKETLLPSLLGPEGWTLNPQLKLLGKARLRQIRVKKDFCEHLVGREEECVADVTPWNVDTESYTPRWEKGSSEGLKPMEAAPWMYRSAWMSQSMPFMGKYNYYPAGGYVLHLGKQMEEAKTIINFMDDFQWVNEKTRAVFIEFTLFCVNTNLFMVVTLLAEMSATGYIIPNYQIDVCKFLWTDPKFEFFFISFTIYLTILIFFFLMRVGVRINGASVLSNLKRSFALVDLVMTLLALLCVILILCRDYYVSELLKRLEKFNNNQFVSFAYAAFWSKIPIYIYSLLLCNATIKLVRLLVFRVTFFRFHATISHSLLGMIPVITNLIVLIVAFTFFFYLVYLNHSYGFSSFLLSLITVILQTAGVNDLLWVTGSYHPLTNLYSVMYILFVMVVVIIYVNFFVAVISFYYRVIHSVPLAEKYNLVKYIKYALTARQQNDIFHLEEGKNLFPDWKNPAVMRLKGGGRRTSKRGTCNRRIKKRRELHVAKMRLSDVITEKPFDATEYKDLTPDRECAMGYLTLSLLSEGKRMSACLRQIALRAYFVSLSEIISDGAKKTSIPGPYFIVTDECGSGVYDKRKFLRMKKVIEKTAKEEKWLKEEEEEVEVLKGAEEKLSTLNEQMNQLLAIIKCKFERE